MIECNFLGEARGVRVKVECWKTTGSDLFADTHLCHCPSLARIKDRPRVCIPGWAGPWVLPHQESEAAHLLLCSECEQRVSEK